jgi:hypothetical protein
VLYENLVADFADRTRSNLEVLKRAQASGERVYEVTALVNSLLGLLVFPQQRFVDSIPETPLGDLRAQGWPVPTIEGDFEQARNLRELIRYLRNAVAHFNLKFEPDQNGSINRVVVWNQRNGRTNWRATLTVVELTGIVERFTEVLSAHHLLRANPTPKHAG